MVQKLIERSVSIIDKIARDIENNSANMVVTYKENFVEISGIKDNETKISNIWAYFINPNEKHGLHNEVFNVVKNEVFDALEGNIKIALKKKSNIISGQYIGEFVAVYREKPTENKKRPDIIIIVDNGYIILENKINASIGDNDLQNEYKETARRLFKNHFYNAECKVEIAGYLTREKISTSKKQSLNNASRGDFYITYDDVFDEIIKDESWKKNDLFVQFRNGESMNMTKENANKVLDNLIYLKNILSSDDSRSPINQLQNLNEFFITNKKSIQKQVDNLLECILNALPIDENLEDAIVHINDSKIDRITWAYFSGLNYTEKTKKYSFSIFYSFGMFGKDMDKIYIKLTSNSSAQAYRTNAKINVKPSGLEYELCGLDELKDDNWDAITNRAVEIIKEKDLSQKI